MTKRRTRGVLLALLLGAPLAASIPGGSMIVAILGISFLIFVHEWGHFYACKLTGTRTETFSIGFGPRLFGWEKGKDGQRRFTVGTRQLDPADHAMDFRVAAIPLGGYVKMAGEIPGEGGGHGGEPQPDEFPAKSALARSFIICAGVIMNFITAILFYAICIQAGKAYEPPIAGLVEQGGAAWRAGIRPGDRFVEVNGNPTPTFLDLKMEIAFASDDEASKVIIERDGKRLPAIEVTPLENEEQGILVFGVGGVQSLSIAAPESEGADGKDGAVFTIGATEEASVAGVPVRGGLAAMRLIQSALGAGLTSIRLEKADKTQHTFTYDPSKQAPDAPEQKPTPKIGIFEYGRPTVSAVSVDASSLFAEKDEILSVQSAGAVVPVDSISEFLDLRFLPSIASFRIRRGAEEKDVAVQLESPVAISRLLDQLAVKVPPGNRIKAFPAGRLTLENGIYRYPSSPALDAGIPAGAAILRVGDTDTNTFDDIRGALADTEAGKPLRVTYRANSKSEPVTKDIVPVSLEYVGQAPWELTIAKEKWESDGIVDSFSMGVARTWRETKGVFRTIGALFAGTISFNKNIAGPITLVTASKRLYEDDQLRLLWFLAYVSVMLAVMNILPIPVLDGGHLMFIIIEKIKGAPLKEETIFNLQKVGMIMLLTLMGFAFWNDFGRLFDSL